MKLLEIIPKEVYFTVCGLDLIFRPFTIADDLKAQDICGGQKEMGVAFENFYFKKISLVAWYQLKLASQRKVLEAVEGVYIDPETGKEINANLKPIDKFRHLFLGIGDQISLIANLVKCKGLNIPDLDNEEELKKWVDQLTKVLPSTGQ